MSDSASILFASSTKGNVEVMADFLRLEGYNPIEAVTLEELNTAIDQQEVDVALIDADGFAPEVWSRCEQLQQQGVPFFVVSQHGETASQKGEQPTGVRVFEKPLGQMQCLGCGHGCTFVSDGQHRFHLTPQTALGYTGWLMASWQRCDTDLAEMTRRIREAK